MTSPAFLLFLKAPRPGTVKTRLMPVLSAEQAALVARSLTKDFVRLLVNNFGDVATIVFVFAPQDAREEIESRMHGSFWNVPRTVYIAQSDGDLGNRMANATEQVAAMGFAPLVLLGTDCPLIPAQAIRQTLDTLQNDRADVVLGPAEDGGYYLAGVQKPQPGLFDNTAWSTDAVLAQTRANAERLGLRVASDLPVCYDIDTPGDLARLIADFAANPSRAEQHCPWSCTWLPELVPLLNVSGADEHP